MATTPRILPVLSCVLLLIGTTTRAADPTEFGACITPQYLTSTQLLDLLNYTQTNAPLAWFRSTLPEVAQQHANLIDILTFPTQDATAPLTSSKQTLPDNLLRVFELSRHRASTQSATNSFPRLLAWEVYNEPDFHFVPDTADRMAAVLKAAYWGLKAGNSNVIVLMPSMALPPGPYAHHFADNNALAYTDGYNFHYYGWLQDFPGTIQAHRSFLATRGYGHLPMWITEAGYFSLPNTDGTNTAALARQQAFHEAASAMAAASWIRTYLAFILTPYTEDGFDLGLAGPDTLPRPALNSYLVLAEFLHDSIPKYRIESDGECIGYTFLRRDPTDGMPWITLLWSPHRPAEAWLPGQPKPAAKPLSLFATVNVPVIKSGLLDPVPIRPPQKIPILLSTQSNAFLATPVAPFDLTGCTWVPIHPPAAPKPIAQPSSIVIQLTPERWNADPDKPSSTYHYNPEFPLETRLTIYNFSETATKGSIRIQSPGPCELHDPETKTHRALNQSGRKETQAFTAEIPALGSRSWSLRLPPSPAPGMAAKSHPANQEARVLQATWMGKPGTPTDTARVRLQPHPKSNRPTFLLKAGDFRPDPAEPDAWSVTSTGEGQIRLTLNRPGRGGMHSIYHRIPTGPNPNARLLGAMRLVKPHPYTTYRINLISRNQVVFRASDDLPFGDYYESIDRLFRDFAPTFWSRAPRVDQAAELTQLEWIRFSFGNLEAGDIIELLDLGLTPLAGP